MHIIPTFSLRGNLIMKENVLITGATGMLGGYLKEEFGKDNNRHIFTLGRSRDNDFVCDLKSSVPDFGNIRFNTIIHCAGTEDPDDSMELNMNGTRHLLQAFSDCLPEYFVYISSFHVYSPNPDSPATEENASFDTDTIGKSKLLAEKMITEWADNNGVILTIIRPARMFGSGVGGETLRLFNDALSGAYIHIRGNNARISLVTALDVARGIEKIYRTGGIFNAADSQNPRFVDMMEAMTANVGRQKRMPHLPASWAEWIWRLGRWIPAIDRTLNPETVGQRMKTYTIDGTKFAAASGIEYFNTIDVISRTDPNYPYAEK